MGGITKKPTGDQCIKLITPVTQAVEMAKARIKRKKEEQDALQPPTKKEKNEKASKRKKAKRQWTKN